MDHSNLVRRNNCDLRARRLFKRVNTSTPLTRWELAGVQTWKLKADGDRWMCSSFLGGRCERATLHLTCVASRWCFDDHDCLPHVGNTHRTCTVVAPSSVVLPFPAYLQKTRGHLRCWFLNSPQCDSRNTSVVATEHSSSLCHVFCHYIYLLPLHRPMGTTALHNCLSFPSEVTLVKWPSPLLPKFSSHRWSSWQIQWDL